MSEWKEYKLGEIVTLYYGKALKSENRVAGDVPVYSSAGISGWHNQVLIDSPSIIIGRKGTIGKVYYNILPFWCIDTAYYILPNNNKYNFNFLYYLLQTLGLDELNEDSAVPGLNRETAYSQDILLPPLPEQKAIASVLSSLDNKIDLLHRQNETLEKMAETLFRQWFVEEAEADWEEVLITELFEVRDGTHDSPKEKAFGKKLITSKHLSEYSIDFNSAYYISEEDYDQINRRSKVESGDILISMIGTVGRIYLEQSREIDYAIKNIGLFKTSCNPIWMFFTYLWLNSTLGKDFVYENISGSTQEYIALGSLRNIKFRVPNIRKIKEFNILIEPFFDKVKSNQQQINTLASLRDTLLPKLMSGEVKVEM